MENMQVDSPVESTFKSPSLKRHTRRSRLGSGSSGSSTEIKSPLCRQNGYANGTAGEVGDENDGSHCSNTNDRVNPFEKDILDGLQKSFWSPSIMEIKETPPQRSWAIEHLSHLFPKDIENSPSTHQNAFPVDDQTEAKAQADIDVYFSRGPIVPTPSPMKERKINGEFVRLNKTTIPYMHCGQSPVARVVSNNFAKNSSQPSSSKKERWTQTSLSFPENLPPELQNIISQYSQTNDLCGISEGTCNNDPQKQEALEHGESGDNNDSGKNSSYLNSSIRRRLELSFGEDPEGDCSNEGPISPIFNLDPFRSNHVVSTPPGASVVNLNTTTSELEMQFMRCEFTPESRGIGSAVTPGITPIQEDLDEEDFLLNRNSASTPRRQNANYNPRRAPKSCFFPTEDLSVPSAINGENEVGGISNNLRRCYPQSPQPMEVKTSSASSFDDSQLLLGDAPKPPKLHRRSTDKNHSS